MVKLTTLARRLTKTLAPLRFGDPITHVYNPLEYAWRAHADYLDRYGGGDKEVLLLGMNPGPWGMAQTGVPFGEVAMVREWLGIEAPVGTPEPEHPKRPILGFACQRSEVSGQRLWGWARDRFGTPEAFFARFFVYNYCPLVFMEASGKNFTPDKLRAEERAPLEAACDAALRDSVEALRPAWVVGVGAFAERCARRAVGEDAGVQFGRILHPSPASPLANRGWAPAAERDFARLGIPLP